MSGGGNILQSAARSSELSLTACDCIDPHIMSDVGVGG